MRQFSFTLLVLVILYSIAITYVASSEYGIWGVVSFAVLVVAFILYYTSNFNEKESLKKTVAELADKLASAEYESQQFARISEKLEEENDTLRRQLSELIKDEK